MVTRLLRLAEPPKPADAADALALAICHVWRGARAAARLRRGASRPRPRAVAPVIAVGHAAGSPPSARTAPWSRSAGSASRCCCTPGTLAGAAGRGAGQAGHQPGRARGLADPLRLRRRRRAAGLRAAADRDRGRAAAGPGDARRAQPRRAAPRGRHRRPGRAHRGARASAARAPSGWSLELKDRLGPPRGGAPGPVDLAAGPRSARLARPGARAPCSGSAGRRARPTRPSPRSPPRPPPSRRPTSAALLRAALRTLSRA